MKDPNPKTWKRPTVSDVEKLMMKAAENQGLAAENYREIHPIMGVNDRTFRRWKNNAATAPNEQSPIPFRAYAQLKSIADQKSYLTPFEGCDLSVIPSEYITNAKNFTSPPTEVLTAVVGLSGVLKTPRKEVARMLGLNANKFCEQVNVGEVSFGTWSLILLLCGVEPSKIFYV